MMKRIRQKTLYLCFFDGTGKTSGSRMVMDETQESLEKLNKMKLNIFNVTRNYLKARYKTARIISAIVLPLIRHAQFIKFVCLSY